jgi:hypothetical protein
MDRLKADFIASLPYAAIKAALLFIFERFERRIWSARRWIRPQNVITSAAGEKGAPRGALGQNHLRRNFFGPPSFETILCFDALHCDIRHWGKMLS